MEKCHPMQHEGGRWSNIGQKSFTDYLNGPLAFNINETIGGHLIHEVVVVVVVVVIVVVRVEGFLPELDHLAEVGAVDVLHFRLLQ